MEDRLRLLAVDLDASFVMSPGGRMAQVNSPDGEAAPRLVFAGCQEGNLVRLRRDVGDAVAREVHVVGERAAVVRSRLPASLPVGSPRAVVATSARGARHAWDHLCPATWDLLPRQALDRQQRSDGGPTFAGSPGSRGAHSGPGGGWLQGCRRFLGAVVCRVRGWGDSRHGFRRSPGHAGSGGGRLHLSRISRARPRRRRDRMLVIAGVPP